MCSGPLLGNIVLYTLPIMLSGILQLLYNAADVIVVGRYAGSTALAAVGSTGSFVNLIVNLLLGLSVGVCVCVAQAMGARDYADISDTVHTAMATSVLAGVAVGALGFAISRTCMVWMKTPEDVLDQAVQYLRIYFLGVPGVMIYNFGAAILRAVGDTRRPLYFLTGAGIVNVCLNLVFVRRFGMGVAGVALATIISQYLSALLIVLTLTRSQEAYHLDIGQLHIDGKKLGSIVRIGLPAGLQSAMFSLSNVIIQSSINSFGSIAMAGNAAAMNIEGFVYMGMNSASQAAMTFTGQNVGARKYERIPRIALCCTGLATAAGIVLGFAAIWQGQALVGVYTPDPEVIVYGMRRVVLINSLYWICGVMDSLVGTLRGMGKAIVPMMTTIFFVCAFRILWTFTVFPAYRSLETLYWSWPISWTAASIVHIIYLTVCYRKLRAAQAPPETPEAEAAEA